jgi:hypothetical protein|nr:MAG TPA: Beta protein [Caudoviricetes sp.]
MYFPYLRGKQFEFIAIRELHEKGVLFNNTIPIFEPVNENFTYFDEFIKKDIIFGIIVNPKVGDLVNNYEMIKKFIMQQNTSNFYVCILTTNNNQEEVFTLKEVYKNYNKIYVHKQYNYFFQDKLNTFDDGYCNLVITSIGNKYNVLNNKVIFEDSFVKAEKNSEYLEKDYFSNYCSNYKQIGFIGISDFLTVGDTFSKSGGQPFAVAIHLTTVENGEIFVRHFISDSIDYRGDTNTKFFQALDKLVQYVIQKGIPKTEGVLEFIAWNEKKHFPNLGSIKKASIKNHIELLSKLV